MKSRDEILEMLVSEVYSHIDNINNDLILDYYNNVLGDTSFLLAGLLELLLEENFDNWNSTRWLDDSLLTKIKLDNHKLSIWGVMIWGIEDSTEQWTEPFYFELILNQELRSFVRCTFLFGDLSHPEITYETFNDNRGYWDKKYYLNDQWDMSERSWKYIINLNPK